MPALSQSAPEDRLAGQRFCSLMHDARVVLELQVGNEFVGIDDHVLPSIEVARVQIEDQHASLNRDGNPHHRRNVEAATADDAFFGEKHHHKLAQPRKLRVGIDRDE
jgi:hypothetical protein